MLRSIRPTLVTACLLLTLGACARTTVRPRPQTSTSFPKPDRILVYMFAVSAAEVRANSGVDQQLLDSIADTTPEARQVEIGHQVATRLAGDLVARIRELGLPAELAKRGTRVTGNALLVDGEFLNIDEGNRLQRLVIGLGDGSSAVDTRVQVYRAARPGAPVLEFTTHADSGTMPGAHRSRSEAQAAESADQAVDYLSEFFAKQEWISPEKARKARRDR